MCLLTNEPLQLAILTEKAGLLLLQAVDVPGEQLIIFHSQWVFVDYLQVLLMICKFCWSFRENLEGWTHSAVCWRIAALDNFSPSWWGSRVRRDAKPEIKILNILANRKKSFGLAKVRIICKNELLLLYSFFCIVLVLHGKYFFYLLFYCIFHLSWCFAYAVSRCCWRSPAWKSNLANFIIIIIITRPKLAYGRQGLAGSWSKDTDQAVTFLGVRN